MKTIGILGGMGPMATVDMFEKIVTNTPAKCDQEHIPVLIDNNTIIPDRTDFIFGYSDKNPLPYLIKSAKKLETMGADFIIMPCNTAHFFYNEIAASIKIPFLSIIEETVKYVIDNSIHDQLGLIGTLVSYNTGIFESVFNKKNVPLIFPSEKLKAVSNKVIFDYKNGLHLNVDEMNSVISGLKERNAETFILGCTEMPLIFKMLGIKEKTIDPTDILAKASVKKALGIS